MMLSSSFLNPLVPLASRAKFNSRSTFRQSSSPARIRCSQDNNTQQQQQQQQLNLSVLRFTLGIPGLDESYLPRYIGYAFGALVLLNHFVGSDSSSITPAQLRTETLGISLAAFSVGVPYLGKFLKGATPTDQKSIPEGSQQIFFMSQNIKDEMKEDLAWGTYVLLRNTNSISVLISVQEELCVRGYWNTPKDVSKEYIPDWFAAKIQKIGFSKLKDTVYFQQPADLELKEMVPSGTRSFLVQPIMGAPKLSSSQTEKSKGFVLLASNIDYAYTDKDKAWIAAIANKFRGQKNGILLSVIVELGIQRPHVDCQCWVSTGTSPDHTPNSALVNRDEIKFSWDSSKMKSYIFPFTLSRTTFLMERISLA